MNEVNQNPFDNFRQKEKFYLAVEEESYCL